MTDEPVLTSSWCTNWGAYNTPRLWSMVMNEDDTQARAQVGAWNSLAGSVDGQRQALLAAKADLVAAWPPEENASAAAFVQELDILITRLDTAAADARTTATGLNNIVNAIQTAKTAIQPLWEKYKDKSTDLVPAWWDSAEDEIDQDARNAMITAERAVQDSVALLKVPEPYKLVAPEDYAETDPGQGDDGSTGSTRSVPSGSGSSGISANVPHNPPPPLPGLDATVPDGAIGDVGAGGGVGAGVGSGGGTPGGGPDLAGVISPPPPPVLPPGDLGLPGGAGTLPTTGGGGGNINTNLPGLLPTGGGGVVPTPTTPRTPRTGVRPATVAGRLPSGAVIGEPNLGAGRGPGGGLGQIGGSGGRGAGGGRGRVGGVGGVGGEGLGGASGRGAAGARGGRVPRPSWLSDDPVGPNRNAGTASGLAGAPGRGNRRARGENDQVGLDPDNPWEVAEGVDPVIEPGRDDARHDPGPNVIGWR